MKAPLRILHLEDDPDYADLVKSLLDAEGFRANVNLVSDQAAFEKALEQRDFDLILADYLLPAYNGIQALKLAHQECPDVPFLLVSGTIGEPAAIESLKCGATDYVLKHWPERLVPAIRRAAQEAEDRLQRRKIETELIRREKYFRSLTENSLDILSVLNQEGVFLYNSPSIHRVLGYEPRDLAGRNAFERVHADDVATARRAFDHAQQDPQQTVTMEFRFQHADGSWRYLEAVGQNRLSDPDICGMVINSRDVSDRRRVERDLRESEKQYRLIFDGNPTPMWVFDQETLAFLEVNDAAVQHYGYSREEFLKMNIRDLRATEDDPALMEYLHKLLTESRQSEMGLGGVWRHRKKDGTPIDVEIKWTLIPFKGRKASLTLATDITERKSTEHRNAALSHLGQHLSSATTPAEAAAILQATADKLFAWDSFTLDLYAAERDRVYPILNVDSDREGRRFEIPVDGEAKEPSRMARRIVAEGAELILRPEPIMATGDTILIGDTSRPSASLMLAPIRNRTKVIGILSVQSYRVRAYTKDDLATLQTVADHCGGALERIRAEQALRESKQRFRDVFEGSPDAILVADSRGEVLDANPAACELHACTSTQLIGRKMAELCSPETQLQSERDFASMLEGRLHQVEGTVRTMEGQIVPVEIRANRIVYAGCPAALLHVRDITDRRLAEAALRSSEMLFHSVWENSVDGMRLTDEQGNIVAVNNGFCKLVGMAREELEGRPFTVIYANTGLSEQSLNKYRHRFRDRAIDRHMERKLTLHNGKAVIFANTNSFVELRGQPTLLLGLFRDVTAQKKLEDELRQSQKMQAIGQLAGGVAHDFNNILTVIHGHASLLLSGGELKDASSRSAQQIVSAAERAAGLTRQLLTFSRRQVMQPKRLDLNEVVNNMTKMLGRVLGEDIALQLQYHPSAATVQADSGMVEQVLLNLVINSRDAMPKGGLLTIRIASVEFTAREVGSHADARLGRFACLSVMDSGCGIPLENLPRIFEPFFTTKEVGKGTGLGLATAYGIAEQHGGWMEVESEPGQGSTFSLYLPWVSEAPPTAQADGAAQDGVRGGSETILVVEDEAPVRELVCELLSSYGYQILEADSGVRALDIWQTDKHRIDLLLTDLVMPNQISGKELADKLWSERPELKVVFTSGYSAEASPAGKDFILAKHLNYLQKPYHPQLLAKTVRGCLDGVK